MRKILPTVGRSLKLLLSSRKAKLLTGKLPAL
jgi:hypothetical protein